MAEGWFEGPCNYKRFGLGVPVPLKGAEGKVLYVWFEAVLGYISASKELSKLKGKMIIGENIGRERRQNILPL